MQINLKNDFKDDYLYEFIEIFLEKENKFLKKKLFLDVKFKLEKSNENYFVN